MAELKPGAIVAFAIDPNNSGATNWFKCDGRAISRTLNAYTFAYLGTIFGPGDGSTTFNIPDLRGRSLVAISPGSLSGRPSVRAIGQAYGSEDVTLSTAQMPSHSHSLTGAVTGAAGAHSHAVTGTTSTDGAHTHTSDAAALLLLGSGPKVAQGPNNAGAAVATSSAGAHSHTVSGMATAVGDHTHTVSATIGATGGATAVPTLPPMLCVGEFYMMGD